MNKRDKLKQFVSDNAASITTFSVLTSIGLLTYRVTKLETATTMTARGMLTMIEMNGGEAAFTEQYNKMTF